MNVVEELLTGLTLDEETIKLFKMIVRNDKPTDVEYSAEALKYGVLCPDLNNRLTNIAIDLYGIRGGLVNATFHKDWVKVLTAPYERLLSEQIFHYLTTYGTNFTSDYVYIPKEKLDIPDLDVDKVKLTVIRIGTTDDLVKEIRTLINGVALSTITVSTLVNIWDYVADKISVNEIKNRELLASICNKYNLVPEDPDNFLRLLLYVASDDTLKIRNDLFLSIIKNNMTNKSDKREKVNDLLTAYIDKFGYEPLASIYNRNKDFIISLKCPVHDLSDENAIDINRYINKISKVAKKTRQKKFFKHTIDVITDTSIVIDENRLPDHLDDCGSIQRIVSIYNTLSYIINSDADDMLYMIRNGKTYVTPKKEYSVEDIATLRVRRYVLYRYIIDRLRENIEGKTFYIPEYVKYAIPVSEKKFVENIPCGSYITFERTPGKDIILATAWNTPCDIDASLIDQSGKIGWDANYRDTENKVLFSGDMTELNEDGNACEAHLISGKYFGMYSINLYGRHDLCTTDIPYKFIIAESDDDAFAGVRLTSVINPNDILTQINNTVNYNNRYQHICDVDIDENHICLTITNENAGSSISSYWSDYDTRKFNSRKNKYKCQLTFNELISICGGKIVTEITKDAIDLSPENINKSTLLDLLK